MKAVRNVVIYLLVVCSLALVGCGTKADENKPIDDVKAESEEMSVEKLRSMALAYKDTLMAKKGEIEKITSQIKDIPIAKMMSDEAKELKTDLEALNSSMSAIKQRFQVYYDKLKAQDGDLSGLKI